MSSVVWENLKWGLLEVKEISKGQIWKEKLIMNPNNNNKIELFLAFRRKVKNASNKYSVVF